MLSSVLRRSIVVTLAVILAGACSETTGPEPVNTSELTFLDLPPDAPPLVTTSASFWATTNENREVRLYFRPRPGAADSSEFLRFRVDAGSLARRPDGSAFASRDSIRISLTVTDTDRLIVDFQPSGLRFSADRPARLKIDYSNADHDFDDDGDVDQDDDALEDRFSIWRQETSGAPWFELGTARRKDIDEVEAEITGFTNHALAYRKPRR